MLFRADRTILLPRFRSLVAFERRPIGRVPVAELVCAPASETLHSNRPAPQQMQSHSISDQLVSPREYSRRNRKS
jgi:hypothetical protein